jgi:hypothetical protein
MKKRYLVLFLIMVIFTSNAKRVIRFNNKTDLPSERFTYFFVAWDDPDKKETKHEPDNIHQRFPHFPSEIDFDQLKDVHTGKPIPEDTPITIIAKTNRPCGLETKGHPPAPIPFEGTLKNAQPITYDVVAKDFKLEFIPVK